MCHIHVGWELPQHLFQPTSQLLGTLPEGTRAPCDHDFVLTEETGESTEVGVCANMCVMDKSVDAILA